MLKFSRIRKFYIKLNNFSNSLEFFKIWKCFKLYKDASPGAFKIDITMYVTHRETQIEAVVYLDVFGPPNSPPINYKK